MPKTEHTPRIRSRAVDGGSIPCGQCGHPRPWHAKNQNGVPGWNVCRMHKAAPALLAALTALVADWDNVDPLAQVPDAINVNEHWDAARAAIAQAKGE